MRESEGFFLACGREGMTSSTAGRKKKHKTQATYVQHPKDIILS
jgi:hypothetical protein